MTYLMTTAGVTTKVEVLCPQEPSSGAEDPPFGPALRCSKCGARVAEHTTAEVAA